MSDTTLDGKMVFNSIVGLVDKKDPEANKGSSRKEEQAKQLAAKEALKNLEPQKMFLGMTDLYSKFDDDGKICCWRAQPHPHPRKQHSQDWQHYRSIDKLTPISRHSYS